MELFKSTHLWYYDGYNSDKVYNATLKKVSKSNLWNVHFSYGRRHSVLKEGIKNPNPLPLRSAMSMYDTLIASKVKKGYEVTNVNITGQRIRFYADFANLLTGEKVLTVDERSNITKMLYSNDPETVKLAELLIETKEQKRWEQI